MPIDADFLLSMRRPLVVQDYDWKDAAIFALGLGYGDDPLAADQLCYVDVDQDMQLHPAMANVLAYDGGWLREPRTGINYLGVVHGEQEMEIHSALPLAARVAATTRIEEVVDKGPGKGALVTSVREIRDADTGAHYATVRHSAFCRGAGGFGGARHRARQLRPVPDRPCDARISFPTSPQLALIYRLSGDLNALHSDPQVARRAGFDRPILHGLATFGIACRALLGAFVSNDGRRVKRLEGRFSAPVYPGETISVEWWDEGPGRAFFAASVGSRTAIVNGLFEYE